MPIGRISGSSSMPDLPAGVEISSGRSINGKSTLFKLILVGSLGNNATTTTAHNISSDFLMVGWQASMNDIVGAYNAAPLPFARTAFATNAISLAVTATDISITTGIDRTNFASPNNFVILEYYYR